MEPLQLKRSGRRPRRAAGLVVNDRVVRAALPTSRGVRAAQVELAPGVVDHGEIIDVEALADAIRQVWAEARIPIRHVALGLTGRDALTRYVEIPDLDNRNLRSAARFELTDMLPFAPSEALFDVHRIDTFTDDRGVAIARLLVGAVHRETAGPLAEAARRARLRPVRADLVSFGMVRAATLVHSTMATAESTESSGVRALVNVGDTSLTVTVHEGGVLRFTRRVSVASGDGDSSAADLEADLHFVEAFRSRSAGAPSAGSAGVALAPPRQSDPLVSAIVGTIEYYTIQPVALPLVGIDLMGDQGRCRTLVPALQEILGTSISIGLLGSDLCDPDPVAELACGPYGQAIGLALLPDERVPGPEPLDLLPPPPPVPTRAVLARAGLIAASAFALGGVVTWTSGPDAGPSAEQADAAEASVASLNARLGALADERSDALALRQGLAHTEAVAAERVPWEILLGRIRASVPLDTTLLGFTGRAPQTTTTGPIPGEIEVVAQASTAASASAWLTDLAELEGVRRPWLSASGTADTDGVAGQATFTITIELEDDLASLIAATPGASVEETTAGSDGGSDQGGTS